MTSPSNFKACLDVCKCFAQMRKPQKNSSVKMHISLVVSWIPRNSFLLPPLLTRQALGTTIVHNRIGIYSNWVGSRLIRFGSSCHKIKQDFSCPKQSKIAIANCRSSLKQPLIFSFNHNSRSITIISNWFGTLLDRKQLFTKVKFCGPQDDQGGYLDSFSLHFSNSQWHIGYIKFCNYEGALKDSHSKCELLFAAASD